MRVIIAGGRDIKRSVGLIYKAVNKSGFDIGEVVSGCANGVDTLGEEFAALQGIPVKQFPADWVRYGKSAGYIRNRQMAEYADALIAVWDGQSRGTANMIKTAEELGLEVFVYKIKRKE